MFNAIFSCNFFYFSNFATTKNTYFTKQYFKPPLKKGIQNIDNSLWATEHYTTLEEKIKIFESRVGMGG